MTVHSLLPLIKTRRILTTAALVAMLGVGISVEAVTNVTITSDIEDRGIGLYTNGVFLSGMTTIYTTKATPVRFLCLSCLACSRWPSAMPIWLRMC